MRKLTRLEKSTAIIADVRATKWCYVDTENEFEFMNKTFVIDKSVEEYKVYNKAGSVTDYTNEAYMEEILVIVDKEDNLKFYDQNYDPVNGEMVRVKGSEWQ